MKLEQKLFIQCAWSKLQKQLLVGCYILHRIAHEVYGDQNNGFERLRVCQNEAAKFSKALDEQFGYLIESLQQGNISCLETQQKFTAVLNRLDQLLMSIDFQQTKLPKTILRTVQSGFLQLEPKQIVLTSRDLNPESDERISHTLKGSFINYV